MGKEMESSPPQVGNAIPEEGEAVDTTKVDELAIPGVFGLKVKRGLQLPKRRRADDSTNSED